MAVDKWTGYRAAALQRAMRLTNEKFAGALGMSIRAVANWHQDPGVEPAAFTQQLLDSTLSRASAEVRARFDALAAASTPSVTRPQGTSVEDGPDDRGKRALLAAVQRGVTADSPDVLAAVAELQEEVEADFDSGSSRSTKLLRLEQGIELHGRDALLVPPIEMVCRVGLDLADARQLNRQCRTESDERRIRRIISQLAVIAADEMSVLGHVPAARSWYSTAISAADSVEDDALRAEVRALAAMLPLYHGSPEDVIELAGMSESLAAHQSCFAAGLAPMLSALAWARIGNIDRAKDSLAAARQGHDRTDTAAQSESVFGFSIRRRLFYESRLLTLIGDHKNARTIQTEALAMYPRYVVGDPALMALDQASSLVAERQYEAGAELAATTVDSLPADQRGRMFLSAARRVLDTIPRPHRALPGVQSSRSTVAELELSSSRRLCLSASN